LADHHLFHSAVTTWSQVVEHYGVSASNSSFAVCEEFIARELGVVYINGDCLAFPVNQKINLVPCAGNKLLDHAHQIQLLVVKVTETEERDILPSSLGEILLCWQCFIRFRRRVIKSDISCVVRSKSEVTCLNFTILCVHLESDMFRCLIAELYEYTVII
jgi:hypothetical protein